MLIQRFYVDHQAQLRAEHQKDMLQKDADHREELQVSWLIVYPWIRGGLTTKMHVTEAKATT